MPKTLDRARRVRDLDDYVPFLVNRAALAALSHSETQMRKYGLTVAKWRILWALYAREPLRVGQLAKATSIEGSTLTRLLDELEAAAMLRRKKETVDTRAFNVTLTERGLRMVHDMMPFSLETERISLQGVSERDRATLRKTLVKIYENIVAADNADGLVGDDRG